ncbi:MAG: HAD-IIB family hydrolase [Methylococcales bacterium]|nr:HAD-IIB family hydrolase [Methylococcales bacterium]
MGVQLLLATDLDRTLLPNGDAPESTGVRDLFRQFTQRPEIALAYVTGRHLGLVEEAIAEYWLPEPDYVVADVGTTIYRKEQGDWRVVDAWRDDIAADWGNLSHQDLSRELVDLTELTLQEKTKQNDFKLSYYLPLSLQLTPLLGQIRQRLTRLGVHAELIYSVDEARQIGLLDIVPARATKFHAVDFLRTHLELTLAKTVFAGDSGNDLPVLVSEIPAVLVANASDTIKQQAQAEAERLGNCKALYQAQGGWRNLNGCYSAGILEGAIHFWPETERWLETL